MNTPNTGGGSGSWHRLHPLSPVIRVGRPLAGIAVLFLASFFNSARRGRFGIYAHIAGAALLLLLAVISWLVTRWCVRDGVLRVETGLLRRQSLRFPLTQLQAVDIVRPGLARLLGLAELRLRMGGSTGRSGRLAFLPITEANSLRNQLLAARLASPPILGDGRETVLVSVPRGRLLISILLTRPALLVLLAAVLLTITALLAPAVAPTVLGSSGAFVIGLTAVLWRRFNSGYRLTIAEADDGLRVRSGLIATAAETIPRGRVQAVRMVEPLLWRPLGWRRLEVDVAGHQRARGENAAEGRQLRAILPVGTAEEVERLLSRILTGVPAERLGPPRRARYRSPLRFHNLAFGGSGACVVATTGRVARTTSWIPLAKVQSLRLVQGPLQNRLALATVHLDAAGRRVSATLADRDADEAGRLLTDLTLRCRAARVAGSTSGG